LTIQSRNAPLRISVPVRFADSEAMDWSYSTPRQILNKLDIGPDIELAFTDTPASRLDAPSRLFLRAIAKGGLQGAQYAIDSIASG